MNAFFNFPSVLRRHWRGELGIEKSFLGVFLFFSILIVPPVLNLISGAFHGSTSLVSIARWSATFICLRWILTFWATIGAWRSTRCPQVTPVRGIDVGAATRVAIFATMALIVKLELVNDVRLVHSYKDLLAGSDKFGVATFEQDEDTGTIHIKGMLGAGSADQFSRLLELNPNVRHVTINSDGGRYFEGLRIAKFVQERDLTTHVDTKCSSACTVVFIAGTQRTASRTARFGFHSGSVTGDPSSPYDIGLNADMAQTYRQFGVSEDFIAEIMTKPPSQMLFLSATKMKTFGLVTRLVG